MAADATAIRVLLADADAVHRARLRRLLHGHDGVRVVAEAPTAEYALTLALRTQPKVLVIDSALPGDDVLELVRRIVASPELPDARVLIRGDGDGVAALRAGASGLLTPSLRSGEVVHAVRLVAAGDVALVPKAAVARIVAATSERPSYARFSRLSIREAEVVSLAARGLRNAQIAEHLQISTETVKTHVRNAMRKLGVHGRAQLAALAFDAGLVEPLPLDDDQ